MATARTATAGTPSFNVVAAIKDYVNKLLSPECVSGMKVLLLDAHTTGIVSLVYSKSQVLAKEVFLFEKLQGTQARHALPDLRALVLVRPTEENINVLAEELAAPLYAEYHLFFTNTLKDSQLKTLADADHHEVVRQVQVFYADIFPLTPELFTLNIESCIPAGGQAHMSSLVGQMSDGLISCFLALKREPIIRYQKNSEMCQLLAQAVRINVVQKGRKLFGWSRRPVLLLMDRRNDPVTPLLMQWTYQAMVHHLFGLHNNRLNLAGCPGVKDEYKEVVLSQEQDDFFARNLYSNFGDLAINVKSALDDLQLQFHSNKNIQTIDDMKSFVENYPEFKKLSGKVTKHITVLDQASKLIDQRKLMDVSAVEQEIACKNDLNTAFRMLVDTLIPDPAVTEVDKVKAVMIYALRYEADPGNKITQLIEKLYAAGVRRDLIGLVPAITRYGGRAQRTGDLFNNTSWLDVLKSSVKRGLQGVKNIYTQHKPHLVEVLDRLSKGELRETEFPECQQDLSYNEKPSEVIIFIVGGATYEEALAIHDLNEQSATTGVRYLLGGSTIHNSKSFLEEIDRQRSRSSLFQ